jgi:preprotein translocase subunit YajC
MVYFITNIIIPLIVLVGMIYVVGHQYREQEARSKARKQAKDDYLNNN